MKAKLPTSDSAAPVAENHAAAPALFVTSKQLAAALNMSPRNIDRLAATRMIPSYLIGGSRRFDPIEVAAVIKKNLRIAAIGE